MYIDAVYLRSVELRSASRPAAAVDLRHELAPLFDEGAPFQALSRDVLRHYIPEAERARFGLTFPAHVALP